MKKFIAIVIAVLIVGLASYYGYDLYRADKMDREVRQIEKYENKLKNEFVRIENVLKKYDENMEFFLTNPNKYNNYRISLKRGTDLNGINSNIFEIKKNGDNLELWSNGNLYSTIYISYYAPYRLAILIDDVGMNTSTAYKFNEIKQPMTFAVLPYLPRTRQAADILRENKFRTILHMPMESKGNEKLNKKTDGLLRTTMDNDTIKKMFEDAIQNVGMVEGFNNHMGSKFTSDQDKMNYVLDLAKEKNLYYVDSWTTKTSVGYQTAKSKGIPTYRSSVFLDNQKDVDYIKGQIKIAVERTLSDEKLIAIGHYHPATAQAILEMLDYIKGNGVELVYVEELLE